MFGIEKMTEAIRDLAVQVSAMRADINTLLFRDVAAEAMKGPDPDEEKRNRMFSEGLANLMAFDGRPQGGAGDAE